MGVSPKRRDERGRFSLRVFDKGARRASKGFSRQKPEAADRSETKEGEDPFPVAGEAPHDRGEVGLGSDSPGDQAQKADREIPEGRPILGSMAGADGRLVLSESDIPAPVEGVLDSPVTAVPGEKVGRRGGGRRVARDPVDGFGAGFAGFNPGDDPRDPVGLMDVGEVQFGPDIVCEGGVEEADLPDIETAVRLVDGPVRPGVPPVSG